MGKKFFFISFSPILKNIHNVLPLIFFNFFFHAGEYFSLNAVEFVFNHYLLAILMIIKFKQWRQGPSPTPFTYIAALQFRAFSFILPLCYFNSLLKIRYFSSPPTSLWFFLKPAFKSSNASSQLLSVNHMQQMEIINYFERKEKKFAQNMLVFIIIFVPSLQKSNVSSFISLNFK